MIVAVSRVQAGESLTAMREERAPNMAEARVAGVEETARKIMAVSAGIIVSENEMKEAMIIPVREAAGNLCNRTTDSTGSKAGEVIGMKMIVAGEANPTGTQEPGPIIRLTAGKPMIMAEVKTAVEAHQDGHPAVMNLTEETQDSGSFTGEETGRTGMPKGLQSIFLKRIAFCSCNQVSFFIVHFTKLHTDVTVKKSCNQQRSK